MNSRNSYSKPSRPSPLSANNIDEEESTISIKKPQTRKNSNLNPKITADDIDYSKTKIPPELMDKLSKFPLFRNAPFAFHKAIASRLKLVQHHAQEYIVRYGEPAKAMYWVLRGSVAVTSPDGEAVFAELVAGQFFGEIGILFNRPRTATVIARTKVLLGVLTVDNFNNVLPDFPVVERMIRDEAQERLYMQDKRARNGVTNIIPNGNYLKDTLSSPGSNASNIANQVSTLPGPSLPPARIKSPSPPFHSDDPLTAKVLKNFSLNQTDYITPQIHDNVDHSIPTRDFLRSLPMFTLLPSNIIHELVLEVEPKRYEPVQYIVKKGDLGRDIYFIVNGEVEVLHPKRISLANSEGNKDKKVERVIARLGTGQYFGEMAFLKSLNNENIGRSTDIRSVSTLDVLVVSGDQLENLISRYPRICDEMRETANKRTSRNEQEENNNEDESPFNKWKGLNYSPKINPIDDNIDPIQRSTSPLSRNESIITAPSPVESIFDDNFKIGRKRSISTVNLSPLDNIPPNQPTASPSISLTVPPLNPVLPSINQFPTNSQQRFQYMNHAKRLRLNSITGQQCRRSSLVTTSLLTDRLLLHIFKMLSLPELMKLRIICRRWRQLLYVAPGFFEKLDLTTYNTSIDDKALIQITDFVGSRPKFIDISDCFHITDVGFCYMVNEIGISGQLKSIKMRSDWEVSAMAIMDLAVPSVGKFIQELDLSNCRKVRDDVVERLIGFKNHPGGNSNSNVQQHKRQGILDNEPIPGMEDFNDEDKSIEFGCKNLKNLNLGYCKHLTDRSMYHIALHASERLESLDLTRCTTITDAGFAYWAYQPFISLKALKLSDCTFLTDKSIIAIASSSHYLEKMDLSFCCALSDVSIEVLCLGCPNLKELDLSFCGSAVSDSTLLAISIHLRNLEKLKIKGCVRVTRAGVDALLSSSIPLKLLDISQCRNVHFYSNNTPAATITPMPNSKSAFVTTSHDNVVEIII